MNDRVDPLPDPSRLPDDAKHLGLIPLTAPELQVASALRADKPLHRAIAWIALLVLIASMGWSIAAAFIH